MYKTCVVFLALLCLSHTAELPPSYPLEKHPVFKSEGKVEMDAKPEGQHPIYRAGERNQGRARIEPVRPTGPVIKLDAMLADQPPASTEVNRIDDGLMANGYLAPVAEVAYPDIPYAPGYLYDTGYSASNNYEMYPSHTYLMEPDASPFGLLWSQVPDARTLVSFVGRTITWVFNSIFVLFVGSLLTVGVCTYTNLCTIAFHGVGPIHEEMRSLMSPERLEKISHAADFVKTAIDKYQKIQKVADGPTMRRRRSVFKY